MPKKSYKVISLMSGTSLDGIDILYCKFWKKDHWYFKILDFETVSYSEDWKYKLKRLIQLTKKELQKIDKDYSEYLANVILKFIENRLISQVDFISSHGHTALHQPDEGFTYQIGNQQIIADITKMIVVCDFRIQDVALGGQGAPLVPIGDQLLFSGYDFCLNLGGFANISFEENAHRVAFDICPVNIVLNHYVSQLAMSYDKGGKIAKSGDIDVSLLDRLNSLEFYKKEQPKSLGLEWVKDNVFPIIDSTALEVKTILRTFVEHCAIQISKYLQKTNKKALFTGGGAYNTFLLERINHYSKTYIIIPDNTIIEFKEALVFGLLGVLKRRNEVNVLASVTGAEKDHSSGKILLPEN